MSRLLTVAVSLCLLWAMACERDGLDGMLTSSDGLGSYDAFTSARIAALWKSGFPLTGRRPPQPERRNRTAGGPK